MNHFRILTKKADKVVCSSPFVFTQKEASDRITNARKMEKANKVGVTYLASQEVSPPLDEIYDAKLIRSKSIEELIELIHRIESKSMQEEVIEESPSVSEIRTEQQIRTGQACFRKEVLTFQEQVRNWLRKRV